MANSEVQNAPAIKEAADQLGDSQHEQQDDWSPNDLNEQQRAQYERGAAAVDEFLADKRTTRYKATDSNQEKLLAFLEDHDLPLSFGGLYVAFEQLSEAGELELSEGDTKDQAAADQEQPDVSARLATAGLARGTKGVESEEAEESEPGPEPKTPRGKPVVAWRNGKRLEVGA